jgi:hypothetical protein
LPSSLDQDSFDTMGSNTFSVEELSGFGLSPVALWVSFAVTRPLAGWPDRGLCLKVGVAESLVGVVGVPGVPFASGGLAVGVGAFGLKKPLRLLCAKPEFVEFSLLSATFPLF